MKIIKRILADITAGNHLDSYIYIPVGIAILIVGLFSNLQTGIYFSVMLAGIMILITSFISLKWAIAGMGAGNFEGLSSFQLTPPPLRETLTHAKKSILVMGTEISVIVRDELEFLTKKAENGCKVQLLFMAPYDELGQPNSNVDYQSEIIKGKHNHLHAHNLITTTKTLQEWLENMNQEARVNIEVKAYFHLMPFKCILIDSDLRRSAMIKIEPYLFKRKTEWKPNFDIELDRSAEAFFTFEKVVKEVWNSATDVCKIHIPEPY